LIKTRLGQYIYYASVETSGVNSKNNCQVICLNTAIIMLMAFEYTKNNIDEYIKGKTWYWYVPLWVFGLYVFWQLLHFSYDKPLPFIIVVPYSFDFMLHEIAHIVVAFLPQVFVAAAGSVSELLLGSLLIFTAFKTRGYFASLFCFLWFMLACESAGTYMADARAQQIPLFSLGAALSGSDQATHDWHFVFGQLHMLRYDTLIGGTVKIIGTVAALFGIFFSAWLMYKMAASTEPKVLNPEEKILLQKSITSASLDDLQKK
jgi:hypothetical protein